MWLLAIPIGFIIMVIVQMCEDNEKARIKGYDLRKKHEHWTQAERDNFRNEMDGRRAAEKRKYQDMADKHNAKVLNDLLSGGTVTKINGVPVQSKPTQICKDDNKPKEYKSY